MSSLDRLGGAAVLVIDAQVGVVGGCHDSQRVLARVGDLVARARAAGVPVIWVQHEDADLAPGSEAWRIAAPLQPRDGEPVVAKSYRDAFVATRLEEELAARGIVHLVVAGAQTDYCVRTTAQRAAAIGYDVTLVSDGHTTTDCDVDSGAVPAEAIIAHTNTTFATLRYPGQEFAARPAGSITFAG